MKKVDLNEAPNNLAMIVYGPSGAGKTRFAGTFPRPRFLSDATEKGWETLRTMPSTALFDAEVKPEVIRIESPRDMVNAIEETKKEVTGKSVTAPLTLVIDSITFYADAYFEAVVKAQGPKPDIRGAYGELLSHIRRLMINTHEIPINIVWLALAKAPEDGQSGIMLAGKSADKVPAVCPYWLFMRAYHDGKGIKHEVRTRPYGPFPARCRDGGKLPDVLPEPTYRCFMNELTKPNVENK